MSKIKISIVNKVMREVLDSYASTLDLDDNIGIVNNEITLDFYYDGNTTISKCPESAEEVKNCVASVIKAKTPAMFKSVATSLAVGLARRSDKIDDSYDYVDIEFIDKSGEKQVFSFGDINEAKLTEEETSNESDNKEITGLGIAFMLEQITEILEKDNSFFSKTDKSIYNLYCQFPANLLFFTALGFSISDYDYCKCDAQRFYTCISYLGDKENHKYATEIFDYVLDQMQVSDDFISAITKAFVVISDIFKINFSTDEYPVSERAKRISKIAKLIPVLSMRLSINAGFTLETP